MTKAVTVTVSSTAYVGKSTIAELIRQKLNEVGIDVELTDDNGIGIVDELPGVIANTLNERIASFKDKKTKVMIKTQYQLKPNI